MDRSVDPCTDFYRYTCGAWIKKNPIPPDQARWDVYGKLNDDNEHFLWGILVEASKPNAGRTVVETEIGDYFAACMDEVGKDRAGIAPLKPALDAIAALPLVESVEMSERDSSRVIAFLNAGGLGLPDRDYYTKTDAKSVEIRQKYVEHVAKMFELLGEMPALAKMIVGVPGGPLPGQ